MCGEREGVGEGEGKTAPSADSWRGEEGMEGNTGVCVCVLQTCHVSV